MSMCAFKAIREWRLLGAADDAHTISCATVDVNDNTYNFRTI